MTRRIATPFRDAHWLFLLISCLFVGSFLTLVPAGWGLDEQSHVNRAFQISQGTFEPVLRGDGVTYGGDIPVDLQDFEMLGHSWSNGVDRSQPFFDRQDFRDRDEYEAMARQTIDAADPLVSVDFTNAGASTSFPYLPAALGFVIGRWVDADVGQMISLSRVLNASAYVLLAFCAIRILRRHRMKWLAFSLALLPSAVFQTSYVTADTFSNGATLLFCSMVALMVLDGGPAQKPLIALLYLAGVGLVASKPTYAALALIVLFIPVDVLGGVGRSLAVKVSLLGVVGACSLGALSSTTEIARAIRLQRSDAAAIDAAQQITGIRADPLEVLSVVGRTVAVYGDVWTQGIVGEFGYNTVAVIQPFGVICLTTLLLATLYSERLPPLFSWGALSTGLVTATAVIMALYLTYTPVGESVSEGVQGRYLIPTLFLLLAAVPTLLPCRVSINPRRVPLLFGTGVTIPLAGGLALYGATLY